MCLVCSLFLSCVNKPAEEKEVPGKTESSSQKETSGTHLCIYLYGDFPQDELSWLQKDLALVFDKVESKGRLDFPKDKTSIAATAGLSFNCGERCVIMLNYDYPLGATKQNSFESVDKRNFFQTHSQSITMSIMWRIGGDD